MKILGTTGFNNFYIGLLNASNADYTIISMPIGHHQLASWDGYSLEGVGGDD